MAKKSVNKSSTRKKQNNVAELRDENEHLKAELARLQENSKQNDSSKRGGSFWRSTFAGLFAVVAVTTFFLFNISYWVKTTVFDTNQFVATVQPLIKDPDIQKALQTEITNQVFAQINLEAELKKALPENLQFIAAPFAGQVKSFTYSKIGDVLNSEQAYNVWTKALTVSHSKIIAYIKDPNNTGQITVNSVYELAGEQLKDSDVGFLFGKSLPGSVGSIELANVEGVPKAREALNVLQKVTQLLAAVSVVSIIIAIAMSHKRRNMIIGLAVMTLLLMVATLLSLQVAHNQISKSVEPQFAAAAGAAQKIITAPLQSQTEGIAALIGAAIFIAIISSNWPSIVWLRSKCRASVDWMTKRIIRTWNGSSYLDWIATNRVVICWTLVAVSFVAFALRLPPTLGGVKAALIASFVAALVLEAIASVSRVAKK